MNRLLFAIFFLLAAMNAAFAQVLDVPTQPASESKYHLASQLSSGPAYGISDGKIRGHYLRLVVHEADIAYDPPTLRIEHFAYGDEACCRTLVKARDIAIDEVLSKVVGPFTPERSGLKIGRWLKPTSVEINYNGTKFVMTELQKNTVKVKRADR